MYSRSKRKKKKTINSNTGCRRKMKLIPINMGYCLLQSDALKFFLGVRQHGRGYLCLTLILISILIIVV